MKVLDLLHVVVCKSFLRESAADLVGELGGPLARFDPIRVEHFNVLRLTFCRCRFFPPRKVRDVSLKIKVTKPALSSSLLTDISVQCTHHMLHRQKGDWLIQCLMDCEFDKLAFRSVFPKQYHFIFCVNFCNTFSPKKG